jgi:hypothetical protein
MRSPGRPSRYRIWEFDGDRDERARLRQTKAMSRRHGYMTVGVCRHSSARLLFLTFRCAAAKADCHPKLFVMKRL